MFWVGGIIFSVVLALFTAGVKTRRDRAKCGFLQLPIDTRTTTLKNSGVALVRSSTTLTFRGPTLLTSIGSHALGFGCVGCVGKIGVTSTSFGHVTKRGTS